MITNNNCECLNNDQPSTVAEAIANCENNCCQNNCCCQNPVDKTLRSMDNNLCDMKATLAEARSNLLFLAQTMCNSRCVNPTEKMLLLNLEQQIKSLNNDVCDNRNNLYYLDCLLH